MTTSQGQTLDLALRLLGALERHGITPAEIRRRRLHRELGELRESVERAAEEIRRRAS